MNLKQFLTDDRAVSPVIGVILMVAITVILAAVIGAFVLGLTDNTQETPQANFSFELSDSWADKDPYTSGSSPQHLNTSTAGSDVTNVTITHKAGDTLQGSNIDVTASGNSFDINSNAGVTEWSAGTSVDATVDNGATIQIVYDDPNQDNTAVIAEYEAPN